MVRRPNRPLQEVFGERYVKQLHSYSEVCLLKHFVFLAMKANRTNPGIFHINLLLNLLLSADQIETERRINQIPRLNHLLTHSSRNNHQHHDKPVKKQIQDRLLNKNNRNHSSSHRSHQNSHRRQQPPPLHDNQRRSKINKTKETQIDERIHFLSILKR